MFSINYFTESKNVSTERNPLAKNVPNFDFTKTFLHNKNSKRVNAFKVLQSFQHQLGTIQYIKVRKTVVQTQTNHQQKFKFRKCRSFKLQDVKQFQGSPRKKSCHHSTNKEDTQQAPCSSRNNTKGPTRKAHLAKKVYQESTNKRRSCDLVQKMKKDLFKQQPC